MQSATPKASRFSKGARFSFVMAEEIYGARCLFIQTKCMTYVSRHMHRDPSISIDIERVSKGLDIPEQSCFANFMKARGQSENKWGHGK